MLLAVNETIHNIERNCCERTAPEGNTPGIERDLFDKETARTPEQRGDENIERRHLFRPAETIAFCKQSAKLRSGDLVLAKECFNLLLGELRFSQRSICIV